jgi:peptidyl-prolyl cis-trans isomerase C
MIRARRHALRTLSAGLLFAALGMVACRPREAPPKPVPPIAASVDGTPIFLAAVQREVSRVRRTEEGKNGVAETSSSPKEIAKAVLGPLIDRQILLAQARADKLVVSDADIQRATDALAETAQQAGQSFTDRLAQDGETPLELHDETRDRLLAEQAIARNVRFERPGAADIRAYADAHKSEQSQPEEVHCAQILVAAPEEAKSVLDQLRAGARFDVLAREHSRSPDGRAGGDLGFFPRGRMPPPFDELCFTLKVGQLSGIVRSDFGFHIFKLLARSPPRRRSIEEVTPLITEILMRERQAAAEAALLAGLRAKATVQIDETVLAQIR